MVVGNDAHHMGRKQLRKRQDAMHGKDTHMRKSTRPKRKTTAATGTAKVSQDDRVKKGVYKGEF